MGASNGVRGLHRGPVGAGDLYSGFIEDYYRSGSKSL